MKRIELLLNRYPPKGVSGVRHLKVLKQQKIVDSEMTIGDFL